MKEILSTKNLNVSYNGVQILKDINIGVKPGEILGIVGESGSGKSTLLKSLIRLTGRGSTIDSGSIFFNGKDITKLSNEELRLIRGKEISTIFQNAGASFCPIRTIEKQFIETVKTHEYIDNNEIRIRISELFSKINLKDTERILKSYPFELSGGMNQRVGIALAIITKPSLILADEPTSALDVTAQAQVIKTLMNVRRDFGTSIIMITHNMGVVSYMVDKIAVMYSGNIVEYGSKRDIISNPCHPYTKLLMKSTPSMKDNKLIAIPGKPPVFGEKNIGCPFVDRCSDKMNKCSTENPSPSAVGNRIVSCHLYEDLQEEKIV